MVGAEWILESVLVLLLGATLFHALRLERALGVLKRDRAVLEALVEGFNDSTRQAESGVERLRAAADGAGRQMARQIETAQRLRDDLNFLSERSEKLAERLEGAVRAARMLPETSLPGRSSASPAAAHATPLATPFQTADLFHTAGGRSDHMFGPATGHAIAHAPDHAAPALRAVSAAPASIPFAQAGTSPGAGSGLSYPVFASSDGAARVTVHHAAGDGGRDAARDAERVATAIAQNAPPRLQPTSLLSAPDDDGERRLRSQAERDLLRALRGR